jgi:ribosomal protein S21
VITTKLSKGESQEALIRRFLRKVKKSEILKEVWDRQYYEKPSAKKNEKKRKRKRVLDKLRKERENEREI